MKILVDNNWYNEIPIKWNYIWDNWLIVDLYTHYIGNPQWWWDDKSNHIPSFDHGTCDGRWLVGDCVIRSSLSPPCNKRLRLDLARSQVFHGFPSRSGRTFAPAFAPLRNPGKKPPSSRQSSWASRMAVARRRGEKLRIWPTRGVKQTEKVRISIHQDKHTTLGPGLDYISLINYQLDLDDYDMI